MTKRLMKQIALRVPEPWPELMDKASEDQSRNAWLRDVIRDALKDAGVWPEKGTT